MLLKMFVWIPLNILPHSLLLWKNMYFVIKYNQNMQILMSLKNSVKNWVIFYHTEGNKVLQGLHEILVTCLNSWKSWDADVKSALFWCVIALTLILLVANLADTKWCKKPLKITETLANGYSFESTQQELSNEYQHARVQMFFKILCFLVLWTKAGSA